MPVIWLVQYLCPRRHAIAAVPYDRDRLTPEDAEAALLTELDKHGIDRHCGLCQSTDLRFEHGKTIFRDWDTAMHELLAAQRENLLTRAFLLEQSIANILRRSKN